MERGGCETYLRWFSDVKRRLRSSAESQQPEDEQQDHRADERNDDLGDDRVAGNAEFDVEQARQHPAKEGPDNAGDDVAEQPGAAAKRDSARQPGGREAAQDPEDEAGEVGPACEQG